MLPAKVETFLKPKDNSIHENQGKIKLIKNTKFDQKIQMKFNDNKNDYMK